MQKRVKVFTDVKMQRCRIESQNIIQHQADSQKPEAIQHNNITRMMHRSVRTAWQTLRRVITMIGDTCLYSGFRQAWEVFGWGCAWNHG